MDLLQKAFNEALARNTADTERWTKYKEDHQQATENLEQFRKAIEIDVMVPIGSKALMPGKLVHTNEIFLSHTPTYYSKCSAHQAMDICKHRMHVAQQRLDALSTERDMYRNKLDLPVAEDAFGGAGKEIIEVFNEDEENRWRQEHREKVKAQKEMERCEREKATAADKSVFDLLEELELMEELDNELDAINVDSDEMLGKILSGEVPLPEVKQRLAHAEAKSLTMGELQSDTLSKIQPPDGALLHDGHKLNDDVLTERSDSSSDSDLDDSDDEQSQIFQRKFHEAQTMTAVEKLEYYEAKLEEAQSLQRKLSNSVKPTLAEVIAKADVRFEIDYLQCEIDRTEDRLEDGECEPLPVQCKLPVKHEKYPKGEKKLTGVKVIRIETDEADAQKTKASHSRSVRFAPEDAVTSFCKFEEPRKVGGDKSATVTDIVDVEAKKHLNDYVKRVANLDVDKTINEMNRLYNDKANTTPKKNNTLALSKEETLPEENVFTKTVVPDVNVDLSNAAAAPISSSGKSILKNIGAVQQELHLNKGATIEETDEEESNQSEVIEFEKILGDIVEKKMMITETKGQHEIPVVRDPNAPRISVFKSRRQK